MDQIKPVSGTQLTSRLATKVTQCTDLYNTLSVYVDNQKKLTEKHKIHLDKIASLMLNTLRVIAEIRVHTGEEKTIPSIWVVSESEFLQSKEVQDAIALSNDDTRPLYFVSQRGKKSKLRKVRGSQPSTVNADEHAQSSSSTESDSDENEEASAPASPLPVEPKKRKQDKAPNPEKSVKAKKSKTTDVAKSTTSRVIKYNDAEWEEELSKFVELTTDEGLVQKLVDFFTTDDNVFHALELINTTNFDFFKIVADEFILSGNEHVDAAFKAMIQGLLDSSPSIIIDDKEDRKQFWVWLNTTGTRYHAYACPPEPAQDPKLTAMLAFIDEVADPKMASLTVQPNEKYKSTPEGFFKAVSAIYRRYAHPGDATIRPESVFPVVHKSLYNIKDALKKFYVDNPKYARLGEEYEVIMCQMKKFPFMNIQEEFLPEITDMNGRRMMMCFDGMTSAYIKWCNKRKLPYCGVSPGAAKGHMSMCGDSCAYCKLYLQVIEHADKSFFWAYAEPLKWKEDVSAPDWFWIKVY